MAIDALKEARDALEHLWMATKDSIQGSKIGAEYKAYVADQVAMARDATESALRALDDDSDAQ